MILIPVKVFILCWLSARNMIDITVCLGTHTCKNNGLVMVAQAGSPHPLWLGSKQGLWHWDVVRSDPEGNEVCCQAACKVFAVSTAPCGVQSYRCSESHVVEKKSSCSWQANSHLCESTCMNVLEKKKKSTLWEYGSNECLGFLAPAF